MTDYRKEETFTNVPLYLIGNLKAVIQKVENTK